MNAPSRGHWFLSERTGPFAGSADSAAYRDLRDAVPKLRHYPSYRIIVEAYFSESGEPQADQALSEERALAVKRFLMWECGVADERVRSIGKGSSDALARLSGESDASYERRSRRAKVILVGK